jgi:hypothetical protein
MKKQEIDTSKMNKNIFELQKWKEYREMKNLIKIRRI